MTINNQQCQLCRCVGCQTQIEQRLLGQWRFSGNWAGNVADCEHRGGIHHCFVTSASGASQPPLSGSCSRHCPRETAASIWMMNGGCRSAPAGTIFSLSSPCLFTRDNVTTTQHSLVFPQRTDWRICEMFIFAKWQSIRWLSGSELEFHWFPVKFSVISVKIEAPSVTDKTEIEGH